METNVVETLEDIKGFLSPLVEEEVRKVGVPQEIKKALLTAVEEIGVRVRGALVLWGCQLGGGSPENVLPVAVAVELIQHSTLVTDDILDNSLLRNSKPSIYGAHGTNIALLVGEILKSTGTSCLLSFLKENDSLPNRWLASELFEETYKDVCVGQILDLKYEGHFELGEDDYLKMIELTTARFIRTPLLLGAMLAGIDDATFQHLSAFGLKLGLAYQIRDDVLDIIAESDLSGKPEALDVANKRFRLPLMIVLKKEESDSQGIRTMLFKDEKLSADDLNYIKKYLESSGATEESIAYVKRFCKEANDELEPLDLPATPKAMLIELSNLVATFDDPDNS